MRISVNRKILLACVIFLFIPVSKIFSENEAQAAITAAADQGKDLGSCTDVALTEGIKYAKENGFTDAATRMEGELASREAQRIEAAKIAEMAAAEAVEELMKEQLVLDEAIQELKNLEEQVSECPDCVDLEVLKTAEEKVEEYKKRVEESKQKLAEAADAMKKAYLELGQFYADTQLSGDPVNVGNGKYVAEYIDFEAQDYGKKWKISRNLNYKNYAEGFGLEWSCSLSSRIIRCTAGPMDDSLKEMEKCLDSINKMLQVCEDYQKKFSGYPNEKINKIHDDCSALLDEINTYKKLALDAKEKNQLLDELNRYVRYGRFEDYKKYYYPEDAIIYVDEDGNDCIFKYKASGTWCAVSSITAAHTVIYSLDENLNVSNTNTAEGGFLVEQENGFKRYFNCYGILIKEVDLNGNENNYRNQ
ncbi:MAG: hypothetical protein MJ188_12585, partial [Treponema sp.]|nr:hypothetical protein [Treponema sp.]